MTVTITVDINVALDVLQEREPHYPASSQVLGMVASGEVKGILPVHALTTLYYLVRKHGSKEAAEEAMDQLLDDFQIGSLDVAGLRRARELSMPDFEDAVVAVVAERSHSSFIVSRNVRDFLHSPVPAITPEDLLGRMAPKSKS